MKQATALRKSSSVLCVEDEVELREDMVEELEDAGFTVIGVDCAENALKILKSESFSLIICDIRLPGISGIDLLKQVRKHEGNVKIPFIVMSAYDDPPLRCSLKKNGASGFLVKPVDYETIVEDILALIAGTMPSQPL